MWSSFNGQVGCFWSAAPEKSLTMGKGTEPHSALCCYICNMCSTSCTNVCCSTLRVKQKPANLDLYARQSSKFMEEETLFPSKYPSRQVLFGLHKLLERTILEETPLKIPMRNDTPAWPAEISINNSLPLHPLYYVSPAHSCIFSRFFQNFSHPSH